MRKTRKFKQIYDETTTSFTPDLAFITKNSLRLNENYFRLPRKVFNQKKNVALNAFYILLKYFTSILILFLNILKSRVVLLRGKTGHDFVNMASKMAKAAFQFFSY